jgi:hypothetical protein
MEKRDVLNSKAVKRFTRGSFVSLGLLVVLSYGFAALVLLCGGENLGNNVFVIILLSVLVVSPAIAFFVFFCQVKWLLAALYSKHDERLFEIRKLEIEEETRLKKEHDEHLLKTRKLEIAGEACIVVAKAIKFDSVIKTDVLTRLEQMLDKFSKL